MAFLERQAIQVPYRTTCAQNFMAALVLVQQVLLAHSFRNVTLVLRLDWLNTLCHPEISQEMLYVDLVNGAKHGETMITCCSSALPATCILRCIHLIPTKPP